jgi:hypothetical protein
MKHLIILCAGAYGEIFRSLFVNFLRDKPRPFNSILRPCGLLTRIHIPLADCIAPREWLANRSYLAGVEQDEGDEPNGDLRVF